MLIAPTDPEDDHRIRSPRPSSTHSLASTASPSSSTTSCRPTHGQLVLTTLEARAAASPSTRQGLSAPRSRVGRAACSVRWPAWPSASGSPCCSPEPTARSAPASRRSRSARPRGQHDHPGGHQHQLTSSPCSPIATTRCPIPTARCAASSPSSTASSDERDDQAASPSSSRPVRRRQDLGVGQPRRRVRRIGRPAPSRSTPTSVARRSATRLGVVDARTRRAHLHAWRPPRSNSS